MSEEMKVPGHWEVKRLGEVCEIIMGQSPPSTTYNTQGIGLPFFQGKAEFTDLYPVVEKWCDSPNKISLPNDILISVRAPVGATNIADTKCCIGRGLAAVRYENFKYIFHFLRSIEKELDKKGTGTTFRAISGETLRATEIPLPPLPEQRAIVAKIEELLSDLENGKQQLLKAQEQLKVYRQSLLKAAFEGKLTKRLNCDEDDFSDLQDKKQISRFKNHGNHPDHNKHSSDKGELPKGWRWVKSNDLFSYVTSGSRGWAKYYSNNGAIFLRMGNLDHDSINLDLADIQYVRLPDKAEGTRSIVREGDILISITADVGMIALVPENFQEAYINQHVALARPIKEIVQPSYLAMFLSSKECGQKQFRALQRGATKVGLGLDDIRSVDVPLPPIDQQNLIVSILESKLTICDNIAATISQSLAQAETLRQSILKKAFEGKLVRMDSGVKPTDTNNKSKRAKEFA